MTYAEHDIEKWLCGRSFQQLRDSFDRDGYIIFEKVLTSKQLSSIEAALAPYFDLNIRGRNEFEGHKSNRIYALLAKSPAFADLVTHPLALAFAEADLGQDCLLSACLAILLQPGETAQPWHFDDSHYKWPRPRPSLGISAFWAIDELTQRNGATEYLPGSHLWPEDIIEGAASDGDFTPGVARDSDIGARADAVKAILPAGSLMLMKGTMWHRGGPNCSDKARLLITPQYCPGWTRPLENMSLAVPPDVARNLSERAQELIGYSIHAPFMGYVDGQHPRRVLKL